MDACKAVRTLRFDFKGRHIVDYAGLTDSQRRNLRNMLKDIAEHLVELILLDFPKDLQSCLPLRFPRLRSFVSEKVNASTIAFIKQNSHIRELRLIEPMTDEKLQRAGRDSNLSQLQTFIGHTNVVPVVLSDSSPDNIILLISAVCSKKELENALKVIGGSDKPVKSIGFHCPLAQRWIFPAIPHYLPHISTLHFGVFSSPLTYRDRVFAGIKEILPILRNVKQIEIIVRAKGDTLSEDDLDKEFHVVLSWSKLTRSLRRVLMPSKTLWARTEGDSNVWVPISTKPAHTQWLAHRPEYKELVAAVSITGNSANLAVLMRPLLDINSVAGRNFGYVYVPGLENCVEEAPE